MAEKKLDRSFNIKTTGIREWLDNNTHYNRCESTPYKALERLFKVYKLNKNDHVVDFGSGKGRVAFYIHYHFEVPVTGIEGNDKTYYEAVNNKANYRKKTKHISAPIRFKYGLAEHYKVKSTDNCFYFFNPFSIQIFRKVIYNILSSVEEENRVVDVILYYPMPEFKRFLEKNTPFKLINKVKVPGLSDKKEKFLIYRYSKQ